MAEAHACGPAMLLHVTLLARGVSLPLALSSPTSKRAVLGVAVSASSSLNADECLPR